LCIFGNFDDQTGWNISGYSSEGLGMFARVSIYEVATERVDAATESFEQVIGKIREMTGLAAAYLLVNAETGRTLTMTLWDSRAAMEASRVTASRIRSEAARGLDGDVLSTEEYEVVARELGEAA
jgi:heme-degrading monooxygenase HmoA